MSRVSPSQDVIGRSLPTATLVLSTKPHTPHTKWEQQETSGDSDDTNKVSTISRSSPLNHTLFAPGTNMFSNATYALVSFTPAASFCAVFWSCLQGSWPLARRRVFFLEHSKPTRPVGQFLLLPSPRLTEVTPARSSLWPSRTCVSVNLALPSALRVTARVSFVKRLGASLILS